MSDLNYFQTRPKVPPIDADLYLKRIGVQKDEPSLAFLKKIHRAHLLQIPFENLDIHYQRKIILDINSIYDKIIRHRRGGFCYELNGLLYHLLARLGFRAFLGSARVFQDGSISPEFDHMVVFVSLDEGNFLCDVGFGELFSEPKRLVTGDVQLDYTRYFRFEHNPDGEWLLRKSNDNSLYESIYVFTLQPRQMIEFLPRCNFHQESDQSHFTKQKLITQLFSEGRITLTDRKIKRSLYGEQKEREILNEDEFLAQLQEIFKINVRSLLRQKFN